jgi:hypothetical protein
VHVEPVGSVADSLSKLVESRIVGLHFIVLSAAQGDFISCLLLQSCPPQRAHPVRSLRTGLGKTTKALAEINFVSFVDDEGVG